ncbi:DNA-binding Xre family transcriptional regulator [Mesobacillus stamsii]|uniref:DNA-binding Xre family transcriptional regulator n=2 Tax=Mesobacillus stamsii TaxID=225347 RepID=A0ABU0FYJ4_9BACI|nr:DNA-binding Xre family transcriptional regulator [Mesobacillus stamsii]
MDVIERVCSHFQCSIEEIVQYIQEGEDEHDERGNLEANSI